MGTQFCSASAHLGIAWWLTNIGDSALAGDAPEWGRGLLCLTTPHC